jgi:hypothetical protein
MERASLHVRHAKLIKAAVLSSPAFRMSANLTSDLGGMVDDCEYNKFFIIPPIAYKEGKLTSALKADNDYDEDTFEWRLKERSSQHAAEQILSVVGKCLYYISNALY